MMDTWVFCGRSHHNDFYDYSHGGVYSNHRLRNCRDSFWECGYTLCCCQLFLRFSFSSFATGLHLSKLQGIKFLFHICVFVFLFSTVFFTSTCHTTARTSSCPEHMLSIVFSHTVFLQSLTVMTKHLFYSFSANHVIPNKFLFPCTSNPNSDPATSRNQNVFGSACWLPTWGIWNPLPFVTVQFFSFEIFRSC